MKVKNIEIGGGPPKVVVSTSRKFHESIEASSAYFNSYEEDFDILEVRSDYFDGVEDEEHISIVQEIAGNFLDSPVIYTYRSSREGGEGKRSVEAYHHLLKKVIENCQIDLIDIEYLTDESVVKDLIACAKKNNIKVLLSNHNFEETPSLEEMQKLIYRMETEGGDILKVAYAPKTVNDTLDVMHAVHKGKSALGDKVIGISMGEMGVITRVSGGTFGSCMTYGYIADTAAPGQVHASKIKEALKAYEQ